MSDLGDRTARRLKDFLANPITNLAKAIVLFLIGLSEASATLSEDINERKLRVGHGLILIGFFGILDAVPHLIESWEARRKYLESRGAHSVDASAGRGRDAEG
jgi:hypothetical protein